MGIVAAPLVKRAVKPVVRSTIAASVGLAVEMKKAAHQVGEEFQDITAEVTAERIGAELRDGQKPTVKAGKA
ncbi:DUF5132 domain-containing protein [Streptomyces sp. NPDC012769]|uniref:DUF5132 domain-containing protein n=1 Tax=Streptomyces sp. NPDC012769 TaxID=3364848 RepID=UPI0036817206